MNEIDIDAFAELCERSYSSALIKRTLHSAFHSKLDGILAIEGLETTAQLTGATVAEVVRRMMGRGLRRAQIHDRLGALHRIFRFALENGYASTNPIDARYLDEDDGTDATWIPAEYQPIAAPPPRERIAPDEVTRLMTHLLDGSATWEGHRLYALVALITYRGLKLGEALGRRLEDFDLIGRTLTIDRSSDSAAQRRRTMPTKLAEILGAWLMRTGCPLAFPGKYQKHPWGSKPAQNTIESAGREVGIEGLTAEGLREFFVDQGGIILLGADFLDRPAPARDYIVPTPGIADRPRKPGRPGRPRGSADGEATKRIKRPRRASSGGSKAVLEVTADGYPIVRGTQLDTRLTKVQASLLRAMIAQGSGLRKGQLIELARADDSGRVRVGDPLRTLRDLKKIPVLGDVIVFPEKGYDKGYGLAEK